jgi:glycosyltransferase involved in cell wall biosynthesis
MHICYIGWADNIHLQRWAQCFAKRGYEVSILTNKKNACTVESVEVFPLKYSDSYWRKLWEVRRTLKKIDADIVHAHYISAFGYPALVSGIRPVIQTAWGSDIYNYPYQNPSTNKKLQRVLEKSDLITCDSLDLKEKIMEIGGTEDRVKVIQWGVDRGLFNSEVDVTSYKEELGLAGKKVILSARHFNPIYNIDIIIRSIPKVIQRFPEAFFILKNYAGLLDNDLKSLAMDLGVTEHTLFLSRCSYEDMVRYYRISDIFVSVPSSDGTPVSLLEAMACGVAPVVSDVPSIREWIVDKKNGRIVPIRDVDALVEAITGLLADERSRSDITTRNLELVKRRGDHKKNMDIMESLYLDLMSKKRV